MIGSIDHQGFTMRRCVPGWRSSFEPWAIGTIVCRAGGSFIDVRLRMRLFEAICTAVWMTFACVGALVASVADLMSGHLGCPPAGGRFSHIARTFREHLRVAGVDRKALFERSETRQPIRLHDLRATFITVAMANGRNEGWIQDRTGHTTSQMLNRYRRAARSLVELHLRARTSERGDPRALGPSPGAPLDQRIRTGIRTRGRGSESAYRIISKKPSDSNTVRGGGLEPPRLSATEPKSAASANSAILAGASRRRNATDSDGRHRPSGAGHPVQSSKSPCSRISVMR